jgi:hypothetical protein
MTINEIKVKADSDLTTLGVTAEGALGVEVEGGRPTVRTLNINEGAGQCTYLHPTLRPHTHQRVVGCMKCPGSSRLPKLRIRDRIHRVHPAVINYYHRLI